MELLALNLAPQTKERPVRARLVDVVRALVPDVVTFNEYVHGPTRDRAFSIHSLCDGPAAAVADPSPSDNRVRSN